MPIPPQELDDFIKRWEHAFGESLSREEAEIQANRLLELFKIIARPLPSSRLPSDDVLAEDSSGLGVS
jgi:hypothetical protein